MNPLSFLTQVVRVSQVLAHLEDDVALKCIIRAYSCKWSDHLNNWWSDETKGKSQFGQFQCKWRDFSFNLADRLKIHTLNNAQWSKAKTCKWCALVFSRADRLNNHKSTHSGQKTDARDVKYLSVDAFSKLIWSHKLADIEKWKCV